MSQLPASPGSDHAPDFLYDAFISYRHVEPDRRWAKWIERSVEGYRLPKGLRNTLAEGERKKRLFLDEDELAASANLSREIDLALQRSRFLIVVCSPRTPLSKWCNEEIERFRKLGRGDQILALLIEGEPIDAFPLALREIRSSILHPDGATHEQISDVEPLAADVRERGEPAPQIRRKALLRLMATMLGLQFYDLSRRDAERRAKRFKILAAAATALMLVMASLTAFAFFERNEALAKEALATRKTIEAINETHLTEFSRAMSSQQLGVALQALDRIVVQLQQPAADPVEVQRRAVMLSTVAEALRNMAADDRTALAFHDPGSADPLIRIGNTLFLARRLQDARDVYAKAVAILSQVPAARRGDFQMALSRALICQARADRYLVRTDSALAALQQAENILGPPDSKNAAEDERCVICLLRAELELDAQNAGGAIAAAKVALDLASNLHTSASGKASSRAVISATMVLGDAMLLSAHDDAALAAYSQGQKKALATLDQLPNDADIAADLAAMLTRIAWVHASQNQGNDIAASCREAANAAEIALKANPASDEASLAAGVSYALLAQATGKGGSTAESAGYSSRSRAILQPFLDGTVPEPPFERHFAGQSLDRLANLEGATR